MTTIRLRRTWRGASQRRDVEIREAADGVRDAASLAGSYTAYTDPETPRRGENTMIQTQTEAFNHKRQAQEET